MASRRKFGQVETGTHALVQERQKLKQEMRRTKKMMKLCQDGPGKPVAAQRSRCQHRMKVCLIIMASEDGGSQLAKLFLQMRYPKDAGRAEKETSEAVDEFMSMNEQSKRVWKKGAGRCDEVHVGAQPA